MCVRARQRMGHRWLPASALHTHVATCWWGVASPPPRGPHVAPLPAQVLAWQQRVRDATSPHYAQVHRVLMAAVAQKAAPAGSGAVAGAGAGGAGGGAAQSKL